MEYATVGTSDFAKETHRRLSPNSHFNGTWENLEKLVANSFGDMRPGYKKGVILVPVPADNFFDAIVEINDNTKTFSYVTKRQEGEAPYVTSIDVNQSKIPAKFVDVVCYHKDVLDEDDDRSTDKDWEIITILARQTKEDYPMAPLTMARNFLHKEGGTKGDFTADQFAESIWFWSTHTKANPEYPDHPEV